MQRLSPVLLDSLLLHYPAKQWGGKRMPVGAGLGRHSWRPATSLWLLNHCPTAWLDSRDGKGKLVGATRPLASFQNWELPDLGKRQGWCLLILTPPWSTSRGGNSCPPCIKSGVTLVSGRQEAFTWLH